MNPRRPASGGGRPPGCWRGSRPTRTGVADDTSRGGTVAAARAPRRAGDGGARRPVVVVGKADARAGLRFDEHPMAVVGQFGDGVRDEADAVFVVLDFPGNAYFHGFAPLSSVVFASIMIRNGLQILEIL